jgi:hypothetical protein
MKNRVEYKESISDSIDRIPFLRQFEIKVKKTINQNTPFHEDISYSLLYYKKINEYMGYDYVRPDEELTSRSVNIVLEEAEKRGDL